ncbi:hypothetical protein ACNS7O_06100 [Haloferacaceae archaeon DSL9]
MADNSRFTTRRTLLAASGSIALFGLAGCLGDDGDDSEGNESGDGDHDDDHEDDHNDTHDQGDDHDEDHDHGDDHDHDDDDHGHGDIGSFDLIDRDADDVVADVHGDHWHGELPEIPVGEHLSLGAVIEDADGNEKALGENEEYELRARVADDAEAGIVDFEFHGDHLHLISEEAGVTDVVFQLWHGDHADYETPAITAQVVEA